MLSHDESNYVKEQTFINAAYNFRNITKIQPLTIKEILTMGRQEYEKRLALLLLTEADIIKIIKEKTGKQPNPEEIPKPLEYLLQSAQLDDSFYLELRNCFTTFIAEDILLLPKINSVLIGPPEEKRLITDSNFSDFQEVLCIQNARPVKEPPPENESEIARKFRLKREMRDAAKKKQQEKKGEIQTFTESMEMAEVFGIDYLNCTLFAFYRLIKRHQAKEKWDQDIQMICAGADFKKMKTKYWGENLEKD